MLFGDTLSHKPQTQLSTGARQVTKMNKAGLMVALAKWTELQVTKVHSDELSTSLNGEPAPQLPLTADWPVRCCQMHGSVPSASGTVILPFVYL